MWGGVINICSRAQTLVEVLNTARLPNEHHSNGHDQTNLQHCHGLGELHATALLNEHHTLAVYLTELEQVAHALMYFAFQLKTQSHWSRPANCATLSLLTSLPKEHHSNCHDQTNLQHCHSLGPRHATH